MSGVDPVTASLAVVLLHRKPAPLPVQPPAERLFTTVVHGPVPVGAENNSKWFSSMSDVALKVTALMTWPLDGVDTLGSSAIVSCAAYSYVPLCPTKVPSITSRCQL